MGWLPGVEQINNARSLGGTYVLDDVPWRLVFHTTEAVPSSVAGARAMAQRHEYPPHLWAWPEKDWLAQTVPLDRSAFALFHAKDDPATNKMKAIQVEVVGQASETPDWPDAWWGWLGERVVRPVVDAGYPINLNLTAPTTGSDGYGETGKVRMSWAAWRSFSGVCCHANVPGNHHWDIGAGRLDLIAEAARGDAPASTPVQEDHMAYGTVYRHTTDGTIAFAAPGIWQPTGNPDQAQFFHTTASQSAAVECNDVQWAWAQGTAMSARGSIDLDALAAKIDALGEGITQEQITAAVKQALREGTG